MTIGTNKLECLPPGDTFYPSLIFENKAKPDWQGQTL
jgi:hypothetical protein